MFFIVLVLNNTNGSFDYVEINGSTIRKKIIAIHNTSSLVYVKMSPKRLYYGVPELHVFKGRKPFSLTILMTKAVEAHT